MCHVAHTQYIATTQSAHTLWADINTYEFDGKGIYIKDRLFVGYPHENMNERVSDKLELLTQVFKRDDTYLLLMTSALCSNKQVPSTSTNNVQRQSQPNSL